MSKTPEGKVKEAVKKVLNTYGAYYFMPIGTMYSKIGVPDIVGCYKGRFFGIECKAQGNKPTPLQVRELKLIAMSGGYSLVVDENNIDDVEAVLKLIESEANG